MTKISSTKDLPSWFNLERYAWAEKATPEMIAHEVCERAWLYTCEMESCQDTFDMQYKIIEKGGYFLDMADFNEVMSICTHLQFKRMDATLDLHKDCILSTSISVRPISVLDAESFGNSVEELQIIDRTGQFDEEIYFSTIEPLRHVSFDMICKKNGHATSLYSTTNIHCAINMEYSNEVILSEIKKLLPGWRKKLGALDKSDMEISNESELIFRKIVTYKAIPLLDLLIWSRKHDVEITNQLLSTVLFPNGDKGEEDVRKTVKPFVKWLCTYEAELALTSAAQLIKNTQEN